MRDTRSKTTVFDRNVTGPGASSTKYDILTGLLVLANQGSALETRLATRLALVITARFNWQRGSFSVGLRELATMWGVTERTAKRDMAQMRARGWISIEVPSARGRVARHRIEFARLLGDTMGYWEAVGPDYVARMTGAPESPGPDNVIPLRGAPPPIPVGDGSVWAEAAARLHGQDPNVYRSWFATLEPVPREGPTQVLLASSRFQADYVRAHFRTRLLAALAAVDQDIRDIDITTVEG